MEKTMKSLAANPEVPAEIDLDELEKLALAATKGPWHVRSHPRLGSFIQAPRQNPGDPYDIELLSDDDTLYETRSQDMAFIVAAQPSVVLSLLQELRAARQGNLGPAA